MAAHSYFGVQDTFGCRISLCGVQALFGCAFTSWGSFTQWLRVAISYWCSFWVWLVWSHFTYGGHSSNGYGVAFLLWGSAQLWLTLQPRPPACRTNSLVFRRFMAPGAGVRGCRTHFSVFNGFLALQHRPPRSHRIRVFKILLACVRAGMWSHPLRGFQRLYGSRSHSMIEFTLSVAPVRTPSRVFRFLLAVALVFVGFKHYLAGAAASWCSFYRWLRVALFSWGSVCLWLRIRVVGVHATFGCAFVLRGSFI